MKLQLVLVLLSLVVIPVIIYYLIKIVNTEGFTSTKPYKELLFFTLEGCGHCENMKPTWNLLKQNYGSNGKIKLIEVKAKENQDLVQLYNVTGFPTLMFVKDEKKVTEYNGDRTYQDLTKYLKHSMAN